MDAEHIDAYLSSLPFVERTLSKQGKLRYWLAKQSESGRMFALMETEPLRSRGEERPLLLSFSAGEEYESLLEEPHFVSAPYLARARWVALPLASPIAFARAKALLQTSYNLTRAKLKSRLQNQIPELATATHR